jgi:drug/metabolite transporter (DMT)-like permease
LRWFFHLIIFFNILFGRIILKNRIEKDVIIGGIIALTGTFLIFYKEFSDLNAKPDVLKAVILCFIGVVLASMGNVLSAFNQKQKLPVLQANAYSMLYGAVILAIISILLKKPLTFDVSNSYIVSLIYLAIFGSIVAFGAYLTVIGKIGPEKAAYIIVVIPIISMIISSIFEDYKWDKTALVGLPILILGNYLAMSKKQIFKRRKNGSS